MISAKSAASLLISAAVLVGCTGYVDRRADRREARAEAAFPPEGRIVRLRDGRRVHAVVEGSGPDLILLHGAGASTRDFTSSSVVDRLRDRYRVIVFDRPGMGYSDGATPGLGGPFDASVESPAQQAAMLHEAAGRLGVHRPVVLGHSYGGAVAMAWALNHDPAALVVLSGATQPWQGRPAGPLYAFTATSLGGAVAVPLVAAFATRGRVREVLGMVFAPQRLPDYYLREAGVALSLRRDSFRANSRQVHALAEHTAKMSRWYPALNLPIEIVHGTADRVVALENHSELLAHQVPGASLTLLEGVGHMPHHVSPRAVMDAADRAAARAGLR